MLLGEVVDASARVAATAARSAKIAALADLLRRLEPDEVEPAVGFLVGEPRHGRIGVGWATLAKRVASRRPFHPPGANRPDGEGQEAGGAESRITVGELDRVLGELEGTTGAGSVGARGAVL